MPDKCGNSLFNAWLRDNRIPSKNVTPIDHLSFIGKRAMGALDYEPAQKLGDDSVFAVEIDQLNQLDLVEVAERNDIQDCKSLIEAVEVAVGKFRGYAMDLGVDEGVVERIEREFLR